MFEHAYFPDNEVEPLPSGEPGDGLPIRRALRAGQGTKVRSGRP
jgi:hypothetical protein